MRWTGQDLCQYTLGHPILVKKFWKHAISNDLQTMFGERMHTCCFRDTDESNFIVYDLKMAFLVFWSVRASTFYTTPWCYQIWIILVLRRRMIVSTPFVPNVIDLWHLERVKKCLPNILAFTSEVDLPEIYLINNFINSFKLIFCFVSGKFSLCSKIYSLGVSIKLKLNCYITIFSFYIHTWHWKYFIIRILSIFAFIHKTYLHSIH